MAEDVRIRKSKRDIVNAFFQLLENNDFHKITVQNICEESLSSRSTFYSHFTDKYQLLESLVEEYSLYFEEMVDKRFSKQGVHEIWQLLEEVSGFYLKNQRRLQILLEIHIPNGDLQKNMEDILSESCCDFLNRQQLKGEVPPPLIAKLYVANVFVFLKWVLEQGINGDTIRFANELQAWSLQYIGLGTATGK